MIEEYYNVFNLEEYKYIQSVVTSSKWQWGHCSSKSTPESAKKLFWWINLTDDAFFMNDLFDKVKQSIGENYDLVGVYANGNTFGLSGSWHRDATSHTFLYYANPSWDISWDGETVFKVDNQIKTYYPHPNKGLLFPGSLWHYAKSPSRDFYDLRVTIAFKLNTIV